MKRNLRILQSLILGGIILIPLVFHTGMSDTFDLPKITMLYLLVIWFGTIWIINEMNKGVLRFKRSVLDIPILIFLGVLGISTLFSIDRALSLWGKYKGYYFGFIPYLGFAGLYWASIQVMDEEFKKKITNLLIVTGFLAALYGILQFCGLEIFDRIPDFLRQRPISSSGNTLYFACYIMMVSFIAFTNILSTRRKSFFFYFQIIAIFIFIIALVLTLSRSAWVGLIGGALFLSIKFRKNQEIRKIKQIIIGSCLIIATMIALWPPAQKKFITIFNKEDSSNIARFEGWKTGIKAFLEHPIIGTGPSTFRYVYLKHKSIESVRAIGPGGFQGDAHNDLIQYLGTTGLAGVISFLFLWYVLFTQGIKKLRKDDNLIELGCFISLLALFLHNQFNFSTVTTSSLSAVLAGILFSNYNEKTISIKIPHLWKKIGKFSVILLALFLSTQVYRFVRADLLYKKGLSFEKGKDMQTAIQLTTKASELIPHNEIYRNTLVGMHRSSAKKTEQKELKRHYINKAVDLAKENVDCHPHSSQYYHNYASVIAWAAQELIGKDAPKGLYDEYTKAWALYRKSIELQPSFVQSWVALAKLSHLMGDIEKSKAICEKVLEMDPNNKEIKVVIEKLNLS